MNFVRKRKRGQRTQKFWFSEEGYRIVWRREVFGISVPPAFRACVRSVIPNFNGGPREVWDFVTHGRRYRTLKAAKADCEKHYRLWTRACEASGPRALKDLFGRLPIAVPLWARRRMNRKALTAYKLESE